MKKVNYPSLHKRVYRQRGQPKLCEHCGITDAKRFEWANKTGNYEDVNDYIRLCKSCHIKMDNVQNFKYMFLEEKICEICGKKYQPLIFRQRYCGSTQKKSGCSYQQHLKLKRIQYFRLKK